MLSRFWKSQHIITALGVLTVVFALTLVLVRAVERVRTAANKSSDT